MDIKNAIEKIFENNIYKFVISNTNSKNCNYIKVTGKKIDEKFQLEKFTKTQVFHEMLEKENTIKYIEDVLKNEFKQLNCWDQTNEYSLKISNKGKVLFKSNNSSQKPKYNTSHNREKNYIFKEGEKIEPLIDMGIFTSEGKVIKSMYDKYKQINRFIEIIDDEVGMLEKEKVINIIDFGCGKSYLTFVMYYYFTQIKCFKVNMTGLDLKEEVINKCNSSAKKYGYKNLKFELGDIDGYKFSEKADIVITLHACDTATDFALFNAIMNDTKMIFSVPCCQHEVNSQIKTEQFSVLTKYGLIKERVSALMTDSIRGNLLEACGYKNSAYGVCRYIPYTEKYINKSSETKHIKR